MDENEGLPIPNWIKRTMGMLDVPREIYWPAYYRGVIAGVLAASIANIIYIIMKG